MPHLDLYEQEGLDLDDNISEMSRADYVAVNRQLKKRDLEEGVGRGGREGRFRGLDLFGKERK